jgi:hypothetical protein
MRRFQAVGCTYSTFLQFERIRYAAEFLHPTSTPERLSRESGRESVAKPATI